VKKLPLYPALPFPPVQKVSGLDQDSDCTLCPLANNNPKGQRCLAAEGTPGGLLIVGEHPTEVERRLGRQFTSAGGRWVRDILDKYAPQTPRVFATGLGCLPPYKGSDDDIEAATSACRPYLARVLEETKPSRVLLFGPQAGESFLGRSFNALSVRRGYSWCFVRDASGKERPTPVFLLPRLSEINGNRLIARAVEADLAEILSDRVTLYPEPLFDDYEIIETVDDAKAAYEALGIGPYVATDVEASGTMFERDFRIECIATSMGRRTFVWPREAIEDPRISYWLARILREYDHTSWNGQYDFCAIECDRKIPLTLSPNHLHADGLCRRPGFGKFNLQSDARLKRKLRDADASATLEVAAELVGMGGHKEENHAAVDAICVELRKLALSSELTPTGKKRKVPPLQYVDAALVPPEWHAALNNGAAPEKFAHRFVPREIEHRYVALDACSTYYLEDWANNALMSWPDDGLLTIWDEVSKPAMWAWARATMNGFPTDKDSVALLADYLKTEADLVLKQIHAYRPGLNPASTKQMGEYMTSLGLKSPRLTDGGQPSWAKEILEGLKDKHPVIPLLLRHRLLTDVNGDQVAGLLPDIRSDGKVHPSFLLDGTGCMPAGELVLTNRGYLRVEDVRIGDSVITHLGRKQAVTLSVINSPAPIYKTTLTNGITLRTTGNHQFWTGSAWIRADKLQPGDPVSVHSAAPEAWAPIEGWPFEVSSWGRVRHSETGTIRSLAKKGKWGHLKVVLTRNGARNRIGGDRKDFPVHRLVLEAFHRKSLPGEEVRHLNGIAWDNTIWNLTWGSSQENGRDAAKHGTMSHRRAQHSILKLTQAIVDQIRALPRPPRGGRFKNTNAVSDAALAAKYGVTRECIRDIRCGLRWQNEDHIVGKQAQFAIVAVHSVELQAADVTYGLTVAEDSSHVTGGVVTHNTGRPSSKEPNFFNRLKGRDEQSRELGTLLRSCHAAPPGWTIIEADEGQIEVRKAADLSRDPAMLAMLNSGVDFHTQSAQKFAPVMGLDYEKMSKEEQDLFREKSKCFHPDTEVLTRHGWRKIADLARTPEWRTTEVMQAIPGSDGSVKLEWILPDEVYTKKHPSKKLIWLKNESIDLRVTPDHRMLQWTDSGYSQVVTPAKFGRQGYWKCAGSFDSYEASESLDLLRLAVAVQADGSYNVSGSGIRFGFSKKRKRDRLCALLTAAALPYTENYYEQTKVWSIYIKASGAKTLRLLLDPDKTMPWSWLLLGPEERRVICDEVAHWDGHVIKGGRSYHFATSIEKNADVLQAIAASVDRKTRKVRTATGWLLSVKDRGYAKGRNVERTELDYVDEVACLSVPSSYVLVRDRGVPVITGQTSNFAAIYEIPAELGFMLSKRLGVDRKVGEELGQALFKTYTGLRAFMDAEYAESWRTGRSRTFWKGKPGRSRPLWQMGKNPPTLPELEAALKAEKRGGFKTESKYDKTEARATYNGAVQGSSVDIITSMLWSVCCFLDEHTNGGLFLLQIYDSIMLMVRDEDVEKTLEFLIALMKDELPERQGYMDGVPLSVDVKKGKSWGSLEKVKHAKKQ
jgi:uracil-DNA glycosylase family 4